MDIGVNESKFMYTNVTAMGKVRPGTGVSTGKVRGRYGKGYESMSSPHPGISR